MIRTLRKLDWVFIFSWTIILAINALLWLILIKSIKYLLAG